MNWRVSTSVVAAPGFIEPCLPTKAPRPPKGDDWVWELKHDGYRLIVRKSADAVRIYSRRGADFTKRFPRIVDAVRRLKVTSLVIDGEGIVYDRTGMPNFDYIHSKQYDHEVSLIAFDLMELDGEDVRPRTLIDRKKRLARIVAKARDGIEFNDHIEGEGPRIFEHACALGHEGIIAKRRGLPYESGRSKRWLKIKNPNSAAAKRFEDGTF